MNNNTTSTNFSATLLRKPTVFYEFHVNSTERCIGITFTLILMLLTLSVNILVCCALTKGKQSFNTSYAFIMNLCVANFVIALFSMPWWVMVELFGSYQVFNMLGPDLFLFFLFIDILGGVASIMSLTVISVARWLTVSHPLDWMHILSFKKCIFIIAGVWIYGVIVGTLKFVKWSHEQTYSLIVFTVGFALPFTVLALAYGRMLLSAKYQQIYRITKWQTKYDKSSEKVKMTRSIEWETKVRRNFKGSRTMAIVTGTFLISWLPFFVISLSYSVNPNIDLKAALAAKWLGYSNALISPLVYTLLDKRLKRAVKRVIRKLKHWFCDRPWFNRVPKGG